MKSYERLLSSRLLELSADAFSNHGCNDMSNETLANISITDLVQLEKDFNKWYFPKSEDYIPFDAIGDWMWMSYLAYRLKQ
jgi:hypothetical protein